jgi:SAM-dependent methyltransferase
MPVPRCPITREPAARHVQWIDPRLLIALWRVSFGVDLRASFRGIERFGLWESPTGLYFFDPMVEGDSRFYTTFYDRLIARKLWPKETIRVEFELAARHVRAGDRVLDVGCGYGHFRRLVPEAHYTGLDPHLAGAAADVRNESLGDHLASHAGHYDVVCSFQVIEHVTDPAAFYAEMVRAARPGGLIILGVPRVPSACTRIPNFLSNAPPHHLTWWTEPALRALAEAAGTRVESIAVVPWSRHEFLLYWMERCSPVRCTDIHYRHAWSWHASTLIGFVGARLMTRLGREPARLDDGPSLLLVARRAGPAPGAAQDALL